MRPPADHLPDRFDLGRAWLETMIGEALDFSAGASVYAHEQRRDQALAQELAEVNRLLASALERLAATH